MFFILFLQANHDSPNPPLVHSPIHQSDLDVDEDDMQDVEIIEFLSTDDEGQSQESEEDQAEARWMILRCFKNWHISEKLVSISIFMLTVADIGFKWKTIEFVSFTQDIHHPPMDQQVPSPIPHHDSDEADMQDTDVMDISLTDEEAQPQESEGDQPEATRGPCLPPLVDLRSVTGSEE